MAKDELDKEIEYDVFSKNRRDGYNEQIASLAGRDSKPLQDYYHALADINNPKRKLSPGTKNDIVKAHRAGQLDKAAKLLGFSSSEIKAIKDYEDESKTIDEQVFKIDKQAKFKENYKQKYESAQDRRSREQYEREGNKAKPKSAERRALEQMFGMNQQQSLTGRLRASIPLPVKIAIPIIIILIWLLNGVAACTFGM